MKDFAHSKPQMSIGHGKSFLNDMVIHHDFSDEMIALFWLDCSSMLQELAHVITEGFSSLGAYSYVPQGIKVK